MTDEQRKARVWHHEMETNEGIHEHAERIVALEELVLELRKCLEDECKRCHEWLGNNCELEGIMHELGVEVSA